MLFCSFLKTHDISPTQPLRSLDLKTIDHQLLEYLKKEEQRFTSIFGPIKNISQEDVFKQSTLLHRLLTVKYAICLKEMAQISTLFTVQHSV